MQQTCSQLHSHAQVLRWPTSMLCSQCTACHLENHPVGEPSSTPTVLQGSHKCQAVSPWIALGLHAESAVIILMLVLWPDVMALKAIFMKGEGRTFQF